jgi:hypothetical protein
VRVIVRQGIGRRLSGLASIAMVLATAVVFAASAAAASSLASDPPSTIIADARSAIDSASTVDVSGTLAQGAQSAAIDLQMVAGKGGYATFSFAHAASYRLVVIGTTLYLNGNRAFWLAEGVKSAVASLVQGRWVRQSAAHGDDAVLASILNPHVFFKGLLALNGTLKKLATTTIAGEAVVPVSNGTYTIDFAATGTPYPVTASAKGTALVIGHVNQPVKLTAPSSAISLPAG